MKNKLFIISLALSGALFAGCSATPGAYSGQIKDDTPVEESSASQVDSGSVSSPSFSELERAVDDERSADSLLQQRLVFFDYDKSIVKEEFLPVLGAHAEFLRRHGDKSVVLNGHADSRGSNEYNLALGQRRADAVRDLLLADGVSPAQVESVSFGEEQPRVLGENEEAWAQNRRVEIRYTDE